MELRVLVRQGVEFACWDAPPALWPLCDDHGIQRRKGYGRIRGLGRDAGISPAEDGVFVVDAMQSGATGPGHALVAGQRFLCPVVRAACPLHRISTDGREVAQLSRGGLEEIGRASCRERV